MRRTNVLIRPLLAALVVAAILVPSAFASGGPVYAKPADHQLSPTYWSYDYQAPIPHPRKVAAVKTTGTDTPWVAIAVTLAGVTLLLGAATVLPRRHRRPVAA
jgi:hypothetical protein